MRTTHHLCGRQEAPWLLSQVHLKSLKLITRAQDPPRGWDYCPSKVGGGVLSCVQDGSISPRTQGASFQLTSGPQGGGMRPEPLWKGRDTQDSSGSPEEALSDLEELVCKTMGGSRGRIFVPRGLSALHHGKGMSGLSLRPPKGWAGWGSWQEHNTCVVKAGQEAPGGPGANRAQVRVFGSSQPGTLGPELPPCRNQAWGPSWGTPRLLCCFSGL